MQVRALVGLMRIGFLASTSLSIPMASRLALRLFLTPPKLRLSPWQRQLQSQGRVETLNVDNAALKVWHYGDHNGGDAIVLVHGWGGRSTSLGRFIDPLVKRGFRVVAFDGPAHGASQGRRTDMQAFASAISQVCGAAGPLRAVIAHSFGAACTLIANARQRLPAQQIVLLSCFSDAIWVTESFAELMRLRPAVIAGMRRLLEQAHDDRWKWEDLAPQRLIPLVQQPMLLVHDQDDEEVPVIDGSRLVAGAGNARLITTKGLGHLKIVKDKAVIDEVLEFLSQPAPRQAVGSN